MYDIDGKDGKIQICLDVGQKVYIRYLLTLIWADCHWMQTGLRPLFNKYVAEEMIGRSILISIQATINESDARENTLNTQYSYQRPERS